MNFSEKRFWFGHKLKNRLIPQFYSEYSISKTIEQLQAAQNVRLQKMIKFCVDNIPFYTDLFRKNNLKTVDIQTIDDLYKIPILTKSIIKSNKEQMVPIGKDITYIQSTTGGSTGTPMQFRMSYYDYQMGIALKYLGWKNGGYYPGDKIAVIGGTSIVPARSRKIIKQLREWILNIRLFSTVNLSEEVMQNIVRELQKFQPKFLRGYPSVLFELARFIESNYSEFTLPLQSIFTVGEQLQLHFREKIEFVFSCKIFDNYGLNDGGLSAYECEHHNGLHIDTERSVLRVVDQNGIDITERSGRIVATTLHNFAFPLINYDTNDLGVLASNRCNCRNQKPILKTILGRSTDLLLLNNIIIGSPAASISKICVKHNIEHYQIRQISKSKIIFQLVSKNNTQLFQSEITDYFTKLVGNIEIEFRHVKSIWNKIDGSKFKFIMNEMKR